MDRRRLAWMTVFATALVAVIALAWNFAVPSGNATAAPTAGADEGSPDDSAPAGPLLTSGTDGGQQSTTTYDAYTTLTRSPDTEEDLAPVPLAATGSVPRTTGTAAATPTTIPSCIDALTGNTARCVTTTAPGPGATGGVCDTSTGGTTAPGCNGGTAFPTTISIDIDPCAAMTTAGCPATTSATVPTTAPATTAPATTAPAVTTAPPVTCFPTCPATTRAVP